MPELGAGSRVSLDWKSGTVTGTVDKVSRGWLYVRLDAPVEDRSLVACRESRVGAVLVDADN